MKIQPFLVEEWMNAYETGAKYNIAETCVDSVSLDELFDLSGTDKARFLDALCKERLTYGTIEGYGAFRKGIAGLYRTVGPEEIIPTHGAAGANHHLFCSLLEPSDRVISIMPTYQQLYSIPESIGAEVIRLQLLEKDGYLPDLSRLRELAGQGVRMICINNPNNPTGALMDEKMLMQIAEIARGADAYVLCDEVYRHLMQTDEWSPSIADLYEKGISVSSMSKVFSLAGLRLGWIAAHDPAVLRACLSHRDYDLISCSFLDERIAALALANREALLRRNRGIVRENLAILDDWMAGEPRLRYVRPQAGTTALVYYEYALDSYDFALRMYRETGAFVTPGDCFEVPRCVRIGYACDRETLRGGLMAFSRFLRTLEAEGR